MGGDLRSDKQKVKNKNIKFPSFAVYEEIVFFGLVFALDQAYRNVYSTIRNKMLVVSGLLSKG